MLTVAVLFFGAKGRVIKKGVNRTVHDRGPVWTRASFLSFRLYLLSHM